MLDMGLSKYIWEEYVATLEPQLCARRNPDFARNLYWMGKLSPELTERTRSAVLNCPPRPYVFEDFSRFACASVLHQQYAGVNKQHIFVWPLAELLWVTQDMLDELRDPVASALGSPWRFLNIKAWTTEAGHTDVGPNEWHMDGQPPGLLKIMIYLTETGGDKGGLDVQFTDGSVASVAGTPGTWILFYNSLLNHRGVAPKLPGVKRVAIELTLVPWLTFDLEPRYLGQNARHPYWPLVKDNDKI